MKTIFFFVMAASALLFFLVRLRRRPSPHLMSVEVIVPAFNEEPVIEQSLINLLRNPYVKRVICVDDGSDETDSAAAPDQPREPRQGRGHYARSAACNCGPGFPD